MSTIKKINFTKKDESVLFVLSSFFLIFFLSYINEGNNSFTVFDDSFAWIIFPAYFLMALVGQFIVSKLLSSIDNGTGKTLISMFLGSVLGVFILVVTFYIFV